MKKSVLHCLLLTYEDLGDLKLVSELLGQQAILVQKQWPVRKTFTPGKKNILPKTLVDPKNIPLPPQNIKLGLTR